MARYWKEKLDPNKHGNYMASSHIGGIPIAPPRDNLVPTYVYFVKVAGFTFQFASPEQIALALDYCRQRTHPSTREPGPVLEHYWQRWYERLPKGLLRGTKREKVIKALEKAMMTFNRR